MAYSSLFRQLKPPSTLSSCDFLCGISHVAFAHCLCFALHTPEAHFHRGIAGSKQWVPDSCLPPEASLTSACADSSEMRCCTMGPSPSLWSCFTPWRCSWGSFALRGAWKTWPLSYVSKQRASRARPSCCWNGWKQQRYLCKQFFTDDMKLARALLHPLLFLWAHLASLLVPGTDNPKPQHGTHTSSTDPATRVSRGQLQTPFPLPNITLFFWGTPAHETHCNKRRVRSLCFSSCEET